MSITKRSFMIICLIISGILLTLNLVTYGLFRYSITDQILTSYYTGAGSAYLSVYNGRGTRESAVHAGGRGLS